MTRVSFQQIYSGGASTTLLHTQKIFDLQRQLATGKKISKASENPEIATRSKNLQSATRRDEQVMRNIENNLRLVGEAENFMESTIEQLHRIRTLAVQGGNDTLATADRALIATEINQQLEGLLRTANARSGGWSLFAGAEVAAAAFVETRNGIGEITAVRYAGDDVELDLEARGRVPVTWPGNRVFAAGQTVLSNTTTNTTWNGLAASVNPTPPPMTVSAVDSARYADRELGAVMIPSSGSMEGSLRINGVLINYDLDGDPTSDEGDSLLDLAQKINEAAPGVRAEVRGVMQGIATTPAGPIAGLTAGNFTLNGETIPITTQDTIFTLSNRINATTGRTGVTAEVLDANGAVVDGTPAPGSAPYRLRLSGGVEISDDASGATNIMQQLGITAVGGQPSGRNLVGSVTEPYALQLTGDRPGPFTIEDASGSLARDLGFIGATGLTETGATVAGGTIFDTLVRMRDALRNGDGAAIRETFLPEIDRAFTSVEVNRTEAGVRTERLENQKARLETIVLNRKKLLSDVEDVDLSEVITELRSQQNAQTAALRAVSDLMKLSLLNYIR
jgi:flagellin-like hook-associated protein FlgL